LYIAVGRHLSNYGRLFEAEARITAAVAASLTGHQAHLLIGHVALLNGPTVFIRRSIKTAQAWREDMANSLLIKPSFKVLNEPKSMKSVDPPLVLTKSPKSYIRPVLRERSGNNPRYSRCRGIAEAAYRVGESNLSDSEDSEHVRKRVAVYPFMR
jgi:hypothetical protein